MSPLNAMAASAGNVLAAAQTSPSPTFADKNAVMFIVQWMERGGADPSGKRPLLYPRGKTEKAQKAPGSCHGIGSRQSDCTSEEGPRRDLRPKGNEQEQSGRKGKNYVGFDRKKRPKRDCSKGFGEARWLLVMMGKPSGSENKLEFLISVQYRNYHGKLHYNFPLLACRLQWFYLKIIVSGSAPLGKTQIRSLKSRLAIGLSWG